MQKYVQNLTKNGGEGQIKRYVIKQNRQMNKKKIR